MSYPARYAVLLDGAFVIQKLSERSQPRVFPTADDVESFATTLSAQACVADQSRLRIYFYHAKPAQGFLRNPISGAVTNLAKTETYRRHQALLESLELRPDFAWSSCATSITA